MRKKVSKARKDMLKAIIEDLLPFQSGRDYGIQSMTNEWLYQEYLQIHQQKLAGILKAMPLEQRESVK